MPWSRFRAMTGDAEASPWLERYWLLGQFASRRATAIRRYMGFVREEGGSRPCGMPFRGRSFSAARRLSIAQVRSCPIPICGKSHERRRAGRRRR